MLGRHHRHPLHPTLRVLVAGGRQWARGAGQSVAYRLLVGLFLVAFLFSRAIMPSPMVHPGYHTLQLDDSALQKLMIITLEFKANTFSGNGVYAQSIARSLAHKGYEVLVVSGKPVQHLSSAARVAASVKSTGNGSRGIKQGTRVLMQETGQYVQSNSTKYVHEPDMTMEHSTISNLSKDSKSGLIELEIEVEQDGWGRLDWKCPWQSFAQGVGNYAKQVLDFNPSWALVVDWSAVPAFEQLVLAADKHWPMAFLNFRIYYVSEYQGNDGEAEKQFYKEMESKAVAMASAVSALSARDAHILATELGAGISPGVMPMPLFPPLREDLRSLALADRVNDEFQTSEKWLDKRKFFTCCVRLSPEKNTQLFASLVEILATFLQEQGIVPFLCGGAQGASAYAEQVKSRLKAAMPGAVIYEGFMGPSQLSHLYSQTLLNLHPCIYDAYGMTIVEAAAFASPSVVHVGPGGAVGAAEFLDPRQKQVLDLDLTMSPASVANAIKQLLLNQSHLAEVGWAASRRSLSWDENANANQLVSILRTAPRSKTGDSGSQK